MSKLQKGYYSIHEAAEILSAVIRGLEAVHSKKFIHRDLKISNILVNVDENNQKVRKIKMQTYKIADFGLSKNQERGTTILGTGYYMSPEILQGV